MSTLSATACAHPNIALAKYWGKREGEGNVPAVPSLSVTLAGMTTTTTVTFDGALASDELSLNGASTDGRPLARASALLDVVRRDAGIDARARIVSANDFPTASGLASSASGFAALALAAVRAAGLDWSVTRVSDLARRSSASAGRSLFGGFVELDGGDGATGTSASVASPSALDLKVLVCVTTEAAKATSSTDGMLLTQRVSPYYPAWLQEAPRLCAKIRAAILAGDFSTVGEYAEKSALAMHACAMAAGIVYVSGATLAALAEVRAMRADGLQTYGTIDAGPHLKCLVRGSDAAAAKERLARVPGVLRILETSPGDGARILPLAEASR
ncbi:Diphosphomevalonate decarboxylase [Labilithrix luteola]|uniref:diphosphomevalonate decarboxylase n=1 Tax=Labilithrix luteola TaxID=1391654 RepID=A0A0K1Q7B5_9BACT|nr:diphosphomevalonate decarboxylase [Labilithrix luteola]AKV01633.1 Diphosphomevalonate decarboxylase [Labilithrix luteola]